MSGDKEKLRRVEWPRLIVQTLAGRHGTGS